MVSPWYYESFHGWFYYHTERNTCHSMHTGTIYRLSMNPLMTGFITWLSETLDTVWTLVWFLLGMNIILSCVVLWLDEEKLWSQYAHWYGFSYGMNYFFMSGFATWRREALVTVCTLVWFLLDMNYSFMSGFITGQREGLVTYAHWYVFSFVWILSWPVLWCDFEKLLLQYAHWYRMDSPWYDQGKWVTFSCTIFSKLQCFIFIQTP